MTAQLFVADDKYGDVIAELEARGWKRFPHLSFPLFDLKWSNYSKIAWKSVRPAQIVNHFQNAVLFSQKEQLTSALYAFDSGNLRAGEGSGSSINSQVDAFFPRTFTGSQMHELVRWIRYSQALAVLKHFVATAEHSTPDKQRQEVDQAMAHIRLVLEDGDFFSPHRRQAALNCTHTEAPAPSSYQSAKSDAGIIIDQRAACEKLLLILKERDPQFDMVGSLNRNVWICKPSNLSQGRGIRLVSSIEDLLRVVQPSDCQLQNGTPVRDADKWVVQKYIERPLLLQQGRKFDLRQWVLIASLEPLRVYWYRQCYLRFCSQPFSLQEETLQDQFTHLSNYSIQKNAPAATEDEEETANTGRMPKVPISMMWNSDRFQDELRKQHGRDVWVDAIVPRMQQATRVAIASIHPKLREIGHGFEWLGLDFMVDENHHVWLLEVNVSPDVSHSTDVTADLVPRATHDTLKLVLDGSHSDAENDWAPLEGFSDI